MNKKVFEEWAEKALNFYNEIAPCMGQSFWQFQTPVDFDNKCELLFVGINPGGGFDFDSETKDTKENKWKHFFNGHKMTMEGFLKGNAYYDPDDPVKILGDSMKRGLSRIGFDNETLNQKHWQFINSVPFSTKDVNKLHKTGIGRCFLDKCLLLTAEYIKLLSPQKTIILGTGDGIDKFPKEVVGDRKTLKMKHRLIIKTTICEIPVIAIPHTASHLLKEEWDEIKRDVQLYLNDRAKEIKFNM